MSKVSLGPVGFYWQVLGACTPCDVLSPWLDLLWSPKRPLAPCSHPGFPRNFLCCWSKELPALLS